MEFGSISTFVTRQTRSHCGARTHGLDRIAQENLEVGAKGLVLEKIPDILAAQVFLLTAAGGCCDNEG